MSRSLRFHHLFVLGLLAASAVSCADAATIAIINLDAPGEGFNDTTVIDEADGFAPGTTLGNKRLAVFQEAASIWAAKLQSNIEIRISARFDPLDCSGGSAILGSAGPGAVAFGYPGLPYADTDYAIAAAEAISNQAILPGNQFQVVARFSSSIDVGCLAGWSFWYGTQRFPSNLNNRILLLPLVLHELAHAFGFASFACISTTACGNTPAGGYASGRLDAWSHFQFDTAQGLYWSQMTNGQRATSMATLNRLGWDGPHVNASLPIWNPGGQGLTNGLQRLNTPSQVNASYSVSHWNPDGTLRLLMMLSNLAAQSGNVRSTDLTDCLFRDIGWTVATTGCSLGANQAPAVAAPAEFRVVEDQFTVLRGIEIADPDAGNGNIELRLGATPGAVYAGANGFPVQTTTSGSTQIVTGRLEAINNYLDSGGISFYPVGASSVLTIEANDLGRNGSGGPRTTTWTVPVITDAINDAPVFGGPFFNPSSNVSLTEGIGPQELAYSNLTITDDAGSNPIQLSVAATTGSLLATSDAGVSVQGTTASRTFVGTTAAIEAYFAANRFRWTFGDDPDINGTLTFVADDLGNTGVGGPLTDTHVVNLSIGTFNDPPSLQAPPTADFFAGGSMPVNSIVVLDPDARSGTMRLRVTVDSGYLVAGTPDGLVVFSGSGTSTLLIDGSRSNINTFIALSKLVYVNPSLAARTATMQLLIDDNGNTGGSTLTPLSATRTINLIANPIYSNGFE